MFEAADIKICFEIIYFGPKFGIEYISKKTGSNFLAFVSFIYLSKQQKGHQKAKKKVEKNSFMSLWGGQLRMSLWELVA